MSSGYGLERPRVIELFVSEAVGAASTRPPAHVWSSLLSERVKTFIQVERVLAKAQALCAKLASCIDEGASSSYLLWNLSRVCP